MMNNKLLTCLLTASLLSGGMHARTIKDALLIGAYPLPGGAVVYDRRHHDLKLSRMGVTEVTEDDVLLLAEKFPGLESLDLAHNEIVSLPSNIHLLRCLTKLNLAVNQLTELPEALWYLQNLTVLILNHNRLTFISPEVRRLRSLEWLSLSFNRLTALPVEIGLLTQLRHLDVTLNQLQTVPESIGHLAQLERLGLNGNLMQTVPASLGNLPQRCVCHVAANPNTSLPQEVARLRAAGSQAPPTMMQRWLPEGCAQQ